VGGGKNDSGESFPMTGQKNLFSIKSL
jgi:hypothetical protein